MTNPLPPQNRGAEEIVLGALMHSNGSVLPDLGDLRAPDFYIPQHAELFTLITRQVALNEPVDAAAVHAELQQRPVRGIDGPYLHSLLAAVPTVANAGYYSQIVQARSTARAIIEAGTRVTQVGYAAAEDDEILTAAEQARRLIDEATTRAGAEPDEPYGVGLTDTIDALSEPPTGIPTPWIGLDQIIHGWKPGRLYAVGARPGCGKSVMGLQAAAHAARSGVPSVVFSLEMSRRELDERLLSSVAEVPYGRIEAHETTDADMVKLAEAQALMYDWPLRIIDRPNINPAQMRLALRQLSRRTPVGLVVVDYLQLMAAPPGSKANRQEVVADFSRSLKLLAKEFRVPVIACSQLNRGSEQRADKVPTLTDLRESGAIEQDCDVVLLLHRELDSPDEAERDVLRVAVAKNRFGARTAVTLDFQGYYQRVGMPRFRVARHPSEPPVDRYGEAS